MTSCEDIHRKSGGNFALFPLICQQVREREMVVSAQGDDTEGIEHGVAGQRGQLKAG
ncbi:MAG: hypothetical protein P8X67_09240 [Syntrophobacterales bacterium]